MISTSVTDIETYRRWKDDEDLDVPWLLNRLQVRTQTPQMRTGVAFHKALEKALQGDFDRVCVPGYTFEFLCDAELYLPVLRECPISKEYNGLMVKGRVDSIEGKIVTDVKSTENPDLERYAWSLPWKFYLDMSECDRFDWHIFHLREDGYDDVAKHAFYQIIGYHKLTHFRYKDMHQECVDAAEEFKQFAEQYFPAAVNGDARTQLRA